MLLVGELVTLAVVGMYGPGFHGPSGLNCLLDPDPYDLWPLWSYFCMLSCGANFCFDSLGERFIFPATMEVTLLRFLGGENSSMLLVWNVLSDISTSTLAVSAIPFSSVLPNSYLTFCSTSAPKLSVLLEFLSMIDALLLLDPSRKRRFEPC